MAGDEITAKEKVQVLLAEYSSLRSHIISRGASIIQMVTIGVASIGLVVSLVVSQTSVSLRVGIFLFLFLLCVIAFFARIIYRDLHEEAAQIRRLEEQINGLVGERLLTWESSHGRAQTGWWHGFFRFRNDRT